MRIPGSSKNILVLACLAALLFGSNGWSQNVFDSGRLDSLAYRPQLLADLGLNVGAGTAPPTPPQMARSKGKATFLSFILPGLGQRYAGRKTRARNFFITEAFLWSSYAGFKIYQHWNENDYRIFAQTHAQVAVNKKNHKYYVNIGNYDDIYAYNAAKLTQRSLDEVYAEQSDYWWQWDNSLNRNKFEQIRIRADNANYRALFMLGTILVNHLVSAIDAVWITRSTEQPLKSSENSRPFYFATSIDELSYRLEFTYTF
ncbi:hypothetical protein L0128_08975 [candidate division KSB1 bacterium]|nr:hypothetical protein [candidate division KSB1 bacterium]